MCEDLLLFFEIDDLREETISARTKSDTDENRKTEMGCITAQTKVRKFQFTSQHSENTHTRGFVANIYPNSTAMVGGARCLLLQFFAQVLAHDSRRAETSRNFAAFRTEIGRSHAA